jgi:hypothetical protein
MKRAQVPPSILVVLCLSAVGACMPSIDGESEEPVGSISFSLTAVPGDAQCLRVTVAGSQKVTRTFDLDPGPGALITFRGVPLGLVTVTGEVFSVGCSSITSTTVPTWITEAPVTAIVTATQNMRIAITLRPTGQVRFDANFDDSGLAVAPASGDLGSATVGSTSRALTFTVRNVGRSPTGAIAAVILGRDAAELVITSNPCTTLAPGQMCAIGVTLRPVVAGPKTATLRITATPGGAAQAALVGVGLTPAALTLTPTEQDFGLITAGTPVGPVAFTLRNTGESPAEAPVVSLTATSPGGLAYTFAGNTCLLAALPPGGECVVGVQGMAARSLPAGSLQTATLSVTVTSGARATSFLRMTIR